MRCLKLARLGSVLPALVMLSLMPWTSCTGPTLQSERALMTVGEERGPRFQVVGAWVPPDDIIASAECAERGLQVEVFGNGSAFISKAPSCADAAKTVPWNFNVQTAAGFSFQVSKSQLDALLLVTREDARILRIQSMTDLVRLPRWVYPGFPVRGVDRNPTSWHWFWVHQEQDGHWSSAEFDQNCYPGFSVGGACSGPGLVGMDPGCTGLGLAVSHCLDSSETPVVSLAEEWLIQRQHPDGGWLDAADPVAFLSDSCATFGLGTTLDEAEERNERVNPRLTDAYARAIGRLAQPSTIQCLLADRRLNDDQRLLTFAWMVLALRGGMAHKVEGCEAGLRVAADAMPRLRTSRVATSPEAGRSARDRGREAVMRACTLLLQQGTNIDATASSPLPSIEEIIAEVESVADVDAEWYFFMTLVFERGEKKVWSTWRDWAKDRLPIARSVRCDTNSSAPCGLWPEAGGRVYGTALRWLYNLHRIEAVTVR